MQISSTKNWFYTILIVTWCCVLKSQPVCGTSEAAVAPTLCGTSSAFTNTYSQQSFYVPTLNDPLIGVNVVFHVILPTTQPINPGLYQPGAGTTQYNSYQQLLNLFNEPTYGLNHASDRFSVLCTLARINPYTVLSNPNIPPNINNGDSRVYYRLANVYYYYNQALAETVFSGTNAYVFESFVNGNYPGRLSEGIPVVLCTTFGKPFKTTLSNGPAVFMGMHAGFDATSHASNQQSNRLTLRHELGHCMGWNHTYWPPGNQHESTDCGDADFLSDVIFENNLSNCQSRPTHTACTGYPINSTCETCLECSTYGTNNVMSDNGTTWDRRWMSPLQMGRRIRSLHLEPVRRFAVDAVSQHTHPLEITSDQVWGFSTQMYRDIVVKSGNKLTISCDLAMAADGKIIVEKGAKLVVTGTIRGWCKKAPAGHNSPLWKGIEIQGDPNAPQVINSSGLCADHGIVEVLNGNIENATAAIITGTTNSSGVLDLNSQGGIIITEQANFNNNVYDIIFYKYNKGQSKSRVVNSMFQTTNEIGRYSDNSIIRPKEHIKLYDNKGVSIEGCHFRNTHEAVKGIGIYSTDSEWYLRPHCISPGVCVIPNKFTSLEYGVYIDNINPLAVALVSRSEINGCLRPIMSENCYNLTVSENTISVKNTGSIYLADQPLIYLYKSKYYKVRNNKLTGDFANSGYNAQHVGIVAYDSKDGAHEIYRNDISNCVVGIIAEDDNGGFQLHKIGLRMHCNIFNSAPSGERNVYDIALTRYLVDPVVMSNQSLLTSGHPKDWVRNLYGAHPNFDYHKWYVVASQTAISIGHRCGLNTEDNPELNGIDLASPQVNVSKVTTPIEDFDHSKHCPVDPNSSGGSVIAISEKIDNLNNYITSLRSGTTSTDHYEIQSAVASKLQIFCIDTVESGIDSTLAVLQNNQGGMDDADVLTVFAHLKNEDYTAAATAADEMIASRADWKAFFGHLIPLHASDDGVWTLLNDSAEAGYYRTVAANEGAAGQAVAQALLRLVFDETHAYPLVFPPSEGNERRAVTAVPTTGTVERLQFFPNPAETAFTIAYSGSTNGVMYSLFSIQGNIVRTGHITNSLTVVDLTGLSNSIYFCRVTDYNGKTLGEIKLMKQ